MARHNTENGQKCCDDPSPFKSTVHKGYNCPCSTTIVQIAHHRISTPSPPSEGPLPSKGHTAELPASVKPSSTIEGQPTAIEGGPTAGGAQPTAVGTDATVTAARAVPGVVPNAQETDCGRSSGPPCHGPLCSGSGRRRVLATPGLSSVWPKSPRYSPIGTWEGSILLTPDSTAALLRSLIRGPPPPSFHFPSPKPPARHLRHSRYTD